jgi:tetratricopeptide (TPR) repeat protein
MNKPPETISKNRHPAPIMRILSFPLLYILTQFVHAEEIVYPIEAYKKLDTFEAHVLNKSDKVFAKKEYRLASKSYDSFMVEFPKSKAITYALLRKGRCLHLDNKRYEAIKEYAEVLDYFPDDVYFAAAAKYYIGACHHENGDLHKALKTWAEMMEDVEYRKHFLAASAIKILADNMLKQEKYDMAVKYYRMVPETFRGKTTYQVIQAAVTQVVYHYIRRQPDETKLRDFYTKAKSFYPHGPRSIPKDLDNDWTYWETVRQQVRGYSSFNQFQKSERRTYFSYWSKELAGKFPDSDLYQLDQAWFAWQSHQNASQWYTRVDQIYAKNPEKEDINTRIIRWLNI